MTPIFSQFSSGGGGRAAGFGMGPMGAGAAQFLLYDSAEFDAFVNYMQPRKTSWPTTGTNYQYSPDASDTYISDAQSDMYDGGNYTYVRVNGNQSGTIGYNSGQNTYQGIRYRPLGYSWPLVVISTNSNLDQNQTYGFSREGNLGADGGGGGVFDIYVYQNATVSGFFPVNAWLVNKAYNQSSDPGVSHLYITVGASQWGSTTSNGFQTTSYSSSSNSDYSYYQSTSTNCFQMTVLVSKGQTNGSISSSQAQQFVNRFLNDARNYFGF